MNQEPPTGFTTEALVSRVIDGDTIEVEVRRRFHVRLIDPQGYFDSPEIRTNEGKMAQKFLSDFLWNKKIKVFIPANQDINLMDITSFRRILGEVWVEGKRLTELLIDKGYGWIRSK